MVKIAKFNANTGEEEITEMTEEEYDETRKNLPVANSYPGNTKLLGQALTDSEIESMEQGQQITDMEIRLLALEANSNG